jgi:hypothetical protein
MELENLLIPVDDYWKKELEELDNSTDTRIKIIKVDGYNYYNEYINLCDLLQLIEDANYEIDELKNEIRRLNEPDEDEDYSYSGGDVRNL